MSTATLKSQIIDKVNSLTDEERKGIETGLEDIKNGLTYTSEQADDMIREWVKKNYL